MPKPAPTEVELFKRGIIRDQSLFHTLKDEKFNDSWHRTVETPAHAQGVADVLNPNYIRIPALIGIFPFLLQWLGYNLE
jgi:hypothetical protein